MHADGRNCPNRVARFGQDDLSGGRLDSIAGKLAQDVGVSPVLA